MSKAGPLNGASLTGKRILVVEDEAMIAEDLVHELRALGAVTFGPCPTVSKAMKVLDEKTAIDCAILDINLRERLVYDVVDRLLAADVPLIFATNFDAGIVPDRYQSIPRCEKPVAPGAIGSLVAAMLA